MPYRGELIGSTIRALRTERKKTQDELSGLAGIARSHLAAIESGKNSPTVETLWQIADALNVKPSMILKAVEDRLWGLQNTL